MRNAIVRFACAAAVTGLAACQAFLSFGDQIVVVYADGGSSPSTSADGGGPDAAVESEAGAGADTSVPSEDAAPPRTLEHLAVGQSAPRTIALNSGYAYWANSSGATIGLYAKDGGTTLLDSGVAANDAYGSHSPQYVVADEGNVYWAMPTGGGASSTPAIRLADADGGGAQTVLGSTEVAARFHGFAQQGSQLYWTTSGIWTAVASVSKSARSGQSDIVAGGTGNQALPSAPGPVVATQDAVFWLEPSTSTISRSGLAQMQQNSDTTPANGPSSLAADDRYVYVLANGELWRMVSVDFSAPKKLDADPGAVEIATYGGYLYWTFATTGDGGVRRIAIEGGPRETLKDGLPGAHWIAVDGSGVYFTLDKGEVCRLVR